LQLLASLLAVILRSKALQYIWQLAKAT